MKFIGYIPFGYPTIEESIRIIEIYIKAGCKAFEISFPIYNAPGESPMIVNFMNKALENCCDYDAYINGVKKIRDINLELEINLLIFFETILKIGKEKFLRFYKEEKINALICPCSSDYIKEKNELIENGVSFFTSFHYDGLDEELRNCLKPNVVVYMQAFPPDWQEVIREDFSGPKDVVKYLRDNGVTAPIYAGVGIKTLENVIEIKEAGADGFFVGGALMNLIGKDTELEKTVGEFIKAGIGKRNLINI
ncbi:MAG: tryptophan synthase subunit alpha [Erysipelotrichaceae bacterium]|jgi:tryptophan synthase alpha chain